MKKLKEMFGGSPLKCLQYWMERFPMLLSHTWYSFEALKVEEAFQKYYSEDYNFSTVVDYMESLLNTPAEQIMDERIYTISKMIVGDLLVKSQASSTWKTVEVSKSPLSFISVCTVRSKLIGTVTVGEGDGSSDKEAEHHLALDMLLQMLTKSPKAIVHELSTKRKVTPSWYSKQILENPAKFRSICTVPNVTGVETTAEGYDGNKKDAEQRASLRVLPKTFTSDELLPFTNLSLLKS